MKGMAGFISIPFLFFHNRSLFYKNTLCAKFKLKYLNGIAFKVNKTSSYY